MTPNLSTKYLGLSLANPLVAAASPLTAQLNDLIQLEQAGVAAAVMMSLFQEQIEEDAINLQRVRGVADVELASGGVYVPRLDDYNCGPDSYLRHLEAAKRAVSIPIIASLNASRPGRWTRFAKLLEQAGADALELNVYFIPTDPDTTGDDVEDRYVELVAAVRAECSIPLAVKLCNCFSSLPNMAQRLIAAGADGLVLFNRSLEPDIDLTTFAVQPRLTLSSCEELRSRLRWIAILRHHVTVSLAGTGGVESTDDVLKLLSAGADVVMVASALIRHGPQYLAVILEQLLRWLQERQFESIDRLRGLASERQVQDANGVERANYMGAITAETEHLREHGSGINE
jgi:dihydroorotate dehydrogenase (fumarate)